MAPRVATINPASQHSPIGFDALTRDLQPQSIQPTKTRQIRGNKGNVRHVKVFLMDEVRTSIIERP
jgi:hypothetical protein